jgi:hypothetical protein
MASCAPKSLSSASSVDIGARKTLPEDPGRTRPELRVSATAQTRIVSEARIRLDSRKSVRAFKRDICADISEFESYMASQAVRSSRVVIRAAPEVQTSFNDLSLHRVGPPDP